MQKEGGTKYILNAKSLLVGAWDRVTAATITSCFRKAGISTENQQQSLDDADDPFQALGSEIEELRGRDEALIPSDITANKYIDTDDSLFTFETCAMTDDEILSEVTSIKEDEEDCEDTDEIKDLIQPPTKYELIQALEVHALQKFSPGGDGGSGRRPLPPDHLTFW